MMSASKPHYDIKLEFSLTNTVFNDTIRKRCDIYIKDIDGDLFILDGLVDCALCVSVFDNEATIH